MNDEKGVSCKSGLFFHFLHVVKHELPRFFWVKDHVLIEFRDCEKMWLTEVSGSAFIRVFVTVFVKSILRLFSGITQYFWVMLFIRCQTETEVSYSEGSWTP